MGRYFYLSNNTKKQVSNRYWKCPDMPSKFEIDLHKKYLGWGEDDDITIDEEYYDDTYIKVDYLYIENTYIYCNNHIINYTKKQYSNYKIKDVIPDSSIMQHHFKLFNWNDNDDIYIVNGYCIYKWNNNNFVQVDGFDIDITLPKSTFTRLDYNSYVKI